MPRCLAPMGMMPSKESTGRCKMDHVSHWKSMAVWWTLAGDAALLPPSMVRDQAAHDRGICMSKEQSWLVSTALKRARHQISVEVDSWMLRVAQCCTNVVARVLQPFVPPECYMVREVSWLGLLRTVECHEGEEHRAIRSSLRILGTMMSVISPVCRQGKGSS
ncbi:hypothetical protein LZ31DRAFT_316335 [Colletotrichum somersetense]|nr:hypothetical protein LZ31DRAFT_316335 [Colletotrichum somersetense]